MKKIEYLKNNELAAYKKIKLCTRLVANSCSGFAQMPVRWTNLILFTVHFECVSEARKISKDIFFHCESVLEQHGCDKRPYARMGIISILDVEGSKFSGANLDRGKPHLHGAIILPDDIDHQIVQKLIQSLNQWKEDRKDKLRSGNRSCWFELINSSKDGAGSSDPVMIENFYNDKVQIKARNEEQVFFHNPNLNSLVKWLVYSSKYVRRTESEPAIHVFPYDLKPDGKGSIDPKYQQLSDLHEQELLNLVAYDPKRKSLDEVEGSQTSRRSFTPGRKGYVPKRNRDFLF